MAKYLVTRTKNTRNVKRTQKNSDNTIIPLRKKKKETCIIIDLLVFEQVPKPEQLDAIFMSLLFQAGGLLVVPSEV